VSEFFQEAYRRARSRYSREQWLALQPAQMTQAIYREMRSMDAERQLPAPEGPADLPAPMRRRGRRTVDPEEE